MSEIARATTSSYVDSVRAFFGPRAAAWDDRFAEDDDAFARAIAELGIAQGATVVDVGCGSGRALPLLRDAVGKGGTVVGVDLTPEMLDAGRERGRQSVGVLVAGDARRLPLADRTVDAALAAGLLAHVPDPEATLRELARVVGVGGRLAVFHPIGRATLASKHGRTLAPDELLAPDVMRQTLGRAGWSTDSVDDAPDRYLVLATRA